MPSPAVLIVHISNDVIADFNISANNYVGQHLVINCLHLFLLLDSFSGDCDKEGTSCSNGVCLDSLCHCNDGFGGCNCQVPGKFGMECIREPSSAH